MTELMERQSEYNGDPLGRLVIPDERDRQFRARPRATDPEGIEALDRGWRYWWQDGWWGDQWYKPQCVSYAWTHWLEDGPITREDKTPGRVAVHGQGEAIIDPQFLYDEAQKVDYWPGEDYDGTSVRAGAKILQEMGYISEYRWSFDIDTTIECILMEGPVVMGSTWYEGMSNPDDSGMVHLTGDVVGGHAFELNGVNMDYRIFRIKNSWGRDTYGLDGNAILSFEDYETLQDDQGEVCLAVAA